jgi:hypothetical protein
MSVKKRRAASSEISREKKLGGHQNERDFADLIGGQRIVGTKKGDVLDPKGHKYSVKSGKKWQIFLYSYERILQSNFLNILTPCLEAFTTDAELYFTDREICLQYKEAYIAKHGREKAKILKNEEIKKKFSNNEYIKSKDKLAQSTIEVCENLKLTSNRRKFLQEAIFNGMEVSFLAIKDDTFRRDGAYRIYEREEVLSILSSELIPGTSNAGHVPEDYNVSGQKTLLRYKTDSGIEKNIVEIEIRNDSIQHFREVRFNMYSKDTLILLDKHLGKKSSKSLGHGVFALGSASSIL